MENTTHNTNTSYRQNVIYILFLDKTFVPFSQAKLKKHSINYFETPQIAITCLTKTKDHEHSL